MENFTGNRRCLRDLNLKKLWLVLFTEGDLNIYKCRGQLQVNKEGWERQIYQTKGDIKYKQVSAVKKVASLHM
jgi:hypothetical protein